jgi:hypothetical protein
MSEQKKSKYRFTFGPWNISTGRDPFGPEVRKEVAFAAKIGNTRSSASTASNFTMTTSSRRISTRSKP